MKLDDSIEGFTNRFLHLCYEFFEEDTDWDLFKEEFQQLVQIYLKHYEHEFFGIVLPRLL